MFDKKAFLESIKEPLRLLVIAILPFLIVYFTNLPYQWAVSAILVLRWLDKYLHESSKLKSSDERNNGIGGVKGLTGF